jgi:hypothetical protein
VTRSMTTDSVHTPRRRQAATQQLGLFDDIAELNLREQVLALLTDQGFRISETGLVLPEVVDKEVARRLHARYRLEKLRRAQRLFRGRERVLLSHFADGSEVDVDKIKPVLVPVSSGAHSLLFRYACLYWSAPASEGVGRRMRFLVMDENNGKLMGIFGLADPVHSLSARDSWIGWTRDAKRERLYHVLDAFVLGALPPYSQLLVGKLIAMVTTSNDVRSHFCDRYRRNFYQRELGVREPHLVLITTLSALGRSSIYNRIKFRNRPLFLSVGFTEGYGHFHLGDFLFEQAKEFLRREGHPLMDKHSLEFRNVRNWRLRVLETFLRRIGLSGRLICHGLKREVFVVPLAHNTREFLCGHTDRPLYYDHPLEELFAFFRERWLLPRAQRDKSYMTWRKENLCIAVQLEQCRRLMDGSENIRSVAGAPYVTA